MDAPRPPPPPPPPPHGASAHGGKAGGLPDGKYDIFVIPPSSAGSGFLYLPSLHTHRNSFLAGSACTALVFFIWSVVMPVIREWFYSVTSGAGSGFVMLIIVVGVGCWAWGKTQAESIGGSNRAGSGGSTGGTFGGHPGATHPNGSAHANTAGAGPKSTWQRSNGAGAGGGAKTSWEKAREETRKKEEERRRTEEAKKRREDAEKERQRQRDKDAREREERERKEKRDKSEKEKAASESAAKEKGSPPKKPPGPTARTETEDDAYSFRPYDRPKRPVHKANSAASMYSESSYAASQTTARTTPPPSQRGPYATKDPDKIIIKGVYSFNNAFMRTPIAQLLSNSGSVTDGLILRITTEGLFIDDDVRGVPQREWDIKAWTMKLAESGEMVGLHVLRASIRDQEGKKYVFVLSQSEGWKVAIGLQRLRRGTQVRALGVSGLPQNETKALLENLGYV